MSASSCSWRAHVGSTRLYQGEAGAPCQHGHRWAAEASSHQFRFSSHRQTRFRNRLCIDRGFSPLGHLHGRREKSRKRRGSWATRCVLEDVRDSDQESGLFLKRLNPEAAGITPSGRFSISDEDFANEGLRFNTTEDVVDLEQLNGLFAKVKFPQRKRSKLRIALQNTLAVVWLLDTERDDALVAFARATGDAVFNATIWDVVVDPSWQKKGLGKAVIERLMVQLLSKGIININLYAESNVVSFYKPLGFVTDPSGISGMAFNKRKASL